MQKYLILLFSLCVIFTGCSKRETNTIQIGFAGVQTGADGQLGTAFYNACQLALDEWNERGGVLGKKIEVISRDDEAKPNQAVAIAHELAARKVPIVIGPLVSGCTLPASPIYEQAGILEMTISTNPQITEQGLHTLFRINGRDDQQGPVIAAFAYNKLEKRKVAILHNKTAFGQGFAEEFKKTFESLGGQASITGVSGEELDFRANVSAIKSEEADAVFWGGAYSQAGPLYNQMRQAGLTIPFLSGDGCFDQSFIETVGQNAEGIYLSFGPDMNKTSGGAEFVKKFNTRFGKENPYSVYGYAAVNVVLQAIQEAKTTDAKQVAAILRSKTFETAMGSVAFDEKGDLKKTNFIIWTVRNGEFTVLE